MKTGFFKTVLVVLVVSVSTAFAAGESNQEGSGILMTLFLIFGALILLFQAVPALITFFSMLKGLFSSRQGEVSFSPLKGKDQPKH